LEGIDISIGALRHCQIKRTRRWKVSACVSAPHCEVTIYRKVYAAGAALPFVIVGLCGKLAAATGVAGTARDLIRPLFGISVHR
jgi:hypothetical protein